MDGHNHYAKPIEDVLTEHPGISEAAVIGLPDDRTGAAIHAVVVAPGLDGESLRGWAGDRLEPAEVPVSITVLDAMPITPLGKPDKQLLRERAAVAR